MFGDFLGICESHRFLCQSGNTTFLATFENLGYFLFQHLVTLLGKEALFSTGKSDLKTNGMQHLEQK